MVRLAPLLLLLLLLVPSAQAQVDDSSKVQAALLAERDSVAPGSTVTVALEERIKPGWHTYWINPGDAGAPTTIAWSLPAGWRAGAIQWPYPKRLPIGPLLDYGYENKVWLLTELTVPKNAAPGDVVTLKAHASWLVCKEICIPEEQELELPLEIGNPGPSDPAFVGARALLPQASPWPARFRDGATLDVFLDAPPLAKARPVAVEFFPVAGGLIVNASEQRLGFASNGVALRLVPGSKVKAAKTLDGVVVLTSGDGSVQAISVQATPGSVPAVSFVEPVVGLGVWFALLFAFVGGIILNVMPCVLPVLAMKVVSLAGQGGSVSHAARQEGLAYGAGAILSFVAFGLLIVALRSGGEQVGWGFQLQEPVVVAAFAVLLFAVGLNLSGIFEFPAIGFGAGLTDKGGAVGAFFTGVLAVAVAAPCTAPFMAAALGFALTQSTALALAVFFALGLGFSLPFLLIALWPSALRVLPKPGVWMLRLKQALALPMYGAALWLLWVLSQQVAMRAVVIVLAAMLVLGIGAWLWNETRNLDGNRRRLGTAAGLVALLLAVSAVWLTRGEATVQGGSLSDASGLPSEPYSEPRLARLRAEGRPVFVNATAAWCITCLVNERAVLSQPALREAFKNHNVTYLVADWTRRDPAITRLLEAHQREGVPLYLFYRKGEEGRVLPQVLTQGAIEDAIGAR
jgi:thiol:disulfide interchange protein DsbD